MKKFVLRSKSGRYVVEVHAIGFVYGDRSQAWEMPQENVDRVKKIMPEGPDFIVEEVT
jgi:hypothetical protein